MYQNKTHNNTVNIIGGGYGLNFSIVNRLHSNNKIKLNIFVRNTEQINIENLTSGNYIIQNQTDSNDNFTQKLIKNYFKYFVFLHKYFNNNKNIKSAVSLNIC